MDQHFYLNALVKKKSFIRLTPGWQELVVVVEQQVDLTEVRKW
jgi:hypothetical protein